MERHLPFYMGAVGAMGSAQLNMDLHRARLQEYAQRLQLGFRNHPAHLAGMNPLAFPGGHLVSPYFHPYLCKDPRTRFVHEEPKPNHSYIGLIAMAILSSRDKKLVLSDIYQWILDNYNYFRTRGPGWRNSIRHNLSLNDCFIKAGRSANGKGHYWAIHPANVDDFQKGDFRRRRAQRRVRKHMGLSVTDDDDDDSPLPSPAATSTATWPVDEDRKPMYFVGQADLSSRSPEQPPQSENNAGPSERLADMSQDNCPPSKKVKGVFDMDSLLAPDTRHQRPSTHASMSRMSYLAMYQQTLANSHFRPFQMNTNANAENSVTVNHDLPHIDGDSSSENEANEAVIDVDSDTDLLDTNEDLTRGDCATTPQVAHIALGKRRHSPCNTTAGESTTIHNHSIDPEDQDDNEVVYDYSKPKRDGQSPTDVVCNRTRTGDVAFRQNEVAETNTDASLSENPDTKLLGERHASGNGDTSRRISGYNTISDNSQRMERPGDHQETDKQTTAYDIYAAMRASTNQRHLREPVPFRATNCETTSSHEFVRNWHRAAFGQDIVRSSTALNN